MTTNRNTTSLQIESVLPKDEKLRGLPFLLDAEELRAQLQAYQTNNDQQIMHFSVEYVRYKPGTNCLATYRVRFVDSEGRETERWYYGKCFLQPDFEVATAKIAAKESRREGGRSSAIVIADQQIIIDEIEADPHLEGLETILNPRKSRRIFYELIPEYPASDWRISHKRLKWEVVRYKPEKRAVIRFTTTATHLATEKVHNLEIYARCHCDDRGQAIYHLMSTLHSRFQGHRRVSVPMPYAYVAEKRILLVAAEQGKSMLDLVTDESSSAILARTAIALAELHKVSNIDLPRRGLESVLEEVRGGAITLKTILPEQSGVVDQIASSLVTGLRESSDRIGFVHGDCHHGQMLFQSEREVLLDFDRSYHGDVLADVGNFCAHLRVLEAEGRFVDSTSGIDAFIAAYEAATDAKVDREHFGYWMTFGLFLLSVRPFRTLQPHWRDRITTTLKLCLQALP